MERKHSSQNVHIFMIIENAKVREKVVSVCRLSINLPHEPGVCTKGWSDANDSPPSIGINIIKNRPCIYASNPAKRM